MSSEGYLSFELAKLAMAKSESSNAACAALREAADIIEKLGCNSPGCLRQAETAVGLVQLVMAARDAGTPPTH